MPKWGRTGKWSEWHAGTIFFKKIHGEWSERQAGLYRRHNAKMRQYRQMKWSGREAPFCLRYAARSANINSQSRAQRAEKKIDTYERPNRLWAELNSKTNSTTSASTIMLSSENNNTVDSKLHAILLVYSSQWYMYCTYDSLNIL